jgi:ribonuclease HI
MTACWNVYYESVCHGENSNCAWGAVIISPDGVQSSKAEFIGEFGSSDTAAIIAATEALKLVPEYQFVNLYSADRYTINAISKNLSGWIQRGWRTKTGPVEHKKVWLAFNDAYKPRNVKLYLEKDITKSPNSQMAKQMALDKVMLNIVDPVDILVSLLVKNLKRYEPDSVVVSAAECYLESKNGAL